MKLSLITPFEKKVFDVAWLELNTPVGNFVILHGYAPTILTLSPNKRVTFCLTNGKQESFTVNRGIAEVNREITTIITDKMLV